MMPLEWPNAPVLMTNPLWVSEKLYVHALIIIARLLYDSEEALNTSMETR